MYLGFHQGLLRKNIIVTSWIRSRSRFGLAFPQFFAVSTWSSSTPRTTPSSSSIMGSVSTIPIPTSGSPLTFSPGPTIGARTFTRPWGPLWALRLAAFWFFGTFAFRFRFDAFQWLGTFGLGLVVFWGLWPRFTVWFLFSVLTILFVTRWFRSRLVLFLFLFFQLVF